MTSGSKTTLVAPRHSQLALLCLYLLALAAPRSSWACEEAMGQQRIANGEYELAYKLLLDCADVSSVSADTLLALAVLHGDYGNFESEEMLARTVYQLLRRAALMGHRDALAVLGDVTETGEPILGLDPQPAKAECLFQLGDSTEEASQESVEKCLRLEEK
jgi:hypothetical protein